jgi:hypothetical protein
MFGRAVVQAVSRRFPTAEARVRARVWSFGIYGEQSGAGVVFLRVFRFPLPIFTPSTALQSPSSITRIWYNRPIIAAVPSGLSVTPLRILIIVQMAGQDPLFGRSTHCKASIYIGQHKHRNKNVMLRVGFETTITEFELLKI